MVRPAMEAVSATSRAFYFSGPKQANARRRNTSHAFVTRTAVRATTVTRLTTPAPIPVVMYPHERVTPLFPGQSGAHHRSLFRNRRGIGAAIGASGGQADSGLAAKGAVGECGAGNRRDRRRATPLGGVRRDARWRPGTRRCGNRAPVGKTG